MNILLVNWQDRLNPYAGGAETHLHEIFGRLVGRGHSVTLLASGWSGAKRREVVDGIDVHRVGSRYSFLAAARPYFRRSLRGQGFDVVVEALNKVPVFSTRWGGPPVVLLVHHLFGATAFSEAAMPIALMTWLLERPLARSYSGVPVQVISRSTAQDLVDRGFDERSIEVITPGVDLDFFTPAPEQRSTEPVFLYLGRLKRYKSIETAIDAVAILRSEGHPVRLVVAGKGDWEPRLKERAFRQGLGDAIVFAGFVTEVEKRAWFRRCWANVFPSPKEGWGMTNLEAAACGTLSLASDSPGLRESVEDGVTGKLVPHGDVVALAAAMRQCVLDEPWRERTGAAALAFAQRFTWDAAARATETHLARSLHESRNRRPLGD